MQELKFTPSIADSSFESQLGDVPVTIAQRWNSRDAGDVGAWYFDIYEADGKTPIALGLKVALGTLIGRACDHPIFTTGAIMARDFARSQREATFDDIGARVRVFYLTMHELALSKEFPR